MSSGDFQRITKIEPGTRIAKSFAPSISALNPAELCHLFRRQGRVGVGGVLRGRQADRQRRLPVLDKSLH